MIYRLGRAPAPMAERYDMLQVLAELPAVDGETRFRCRCDCGNTIVVPRQRLRSGDRTSCGCKKRVHAKRPPIPDGARFGRLEVLARAGVANDGQHLYQCRCECGWVGRIRGKSLRNGETQSCGCLRNERAREANIRRAGRRVTQ